MRGAQAIRSGIAPADDHHAFARGQDLPLHNIAGAAAVLLGQILHGEVNSLQLAPRHGEVAGTFRAARQQQGVELAAQIFHRHVLAHVRARLEDHALLKHLVEAPVKDGFLHLEIRNAIAQQAADAIGLFEQGHRMPGAVQLLRGGKPRRPRADHGHAFAGADAGAVPAGSSLP